MCGEELDRELEGAVNGTTAGEILGSPQQRDEGVFAFICASIEKRMREQKGDWLMASHLFAAIVLSLVDVYVSADRIKSVRGTAISIDDTLLLHSAFKCAV